MTEIRWKNGGPLFIQPRPGGGPIGLVAADPDCCCSDVDPPPPPRCWSCLDTCAYFIEVVEPSDLIAKTGAIECQTLSSVNGSVATFPFKSFLPEGTLYFYDQSLSEVSNVGWRSYPIGLVPQGFYGFVVHGASGRVPTENPLCTSIEGAGGPYPAVFGVRAAITSAVYCDSSKPDTPFTLIVDTSVRVVLREADPFVGIGSCALPCAGEYRFDAAVSLDLDSSCQNVERRQCFSVPQEPGRVLHTPVTVSADKDGTSLGDYDSVTETSCGDLQGLAESIGHQIRDALTATFRITSRPACNNIPADCNVPIEGRIVYFPRDGVAVYGYELGTPKTDVYDFGAWEFAHDGVANGTAESPYVFNAKKFAENPAGFILEEHNLEVFCALDDTVTPPVSRWYVRETVYCSPDFSTLTTDQWISEIPSFPEPNRDVPCAGIDAGDPVPVGVPEYERVDGYPITNYGAGCVPPSPIGLNIQDSCG